MNFEQDLKKGQDAEDVFCDVCHAYGYTNPKRVTGYFPDYDIETDLGTVEIKRDIKSQETGNFFFEYESGGKPSGLAVTKADYFAIVNLYEKKIYIALTRDVKDFLRQHWDLMKKHEGAGDGTVKGITIPKDWYVRSNVSGLEVWNL